MVVAVVALVALARFVLSDAGGVIFSLILAFLASIAMEPAVAKLSTSMKRGFATAIVMFGSIVLFGAFLFLFGRLLSDQIGTFAQSVPQLLEDLTTWAAERFGIELDYQQMLDQLGVGTSTLTTIAQNLAGGVLGFVASVVAAAFSTLTFVFFTYYFSADGPRLRRWIAQLVPQRQQEVFGLMWELAVRKTGGYVTARIVLAAICGSLTALFMLIIGMPYWLALGIWTGVVAQFVPTVGTYIAIALPVIIGLIGENPWQAWPCSPSRSSTSRSRTSRSSRGSRRRPSTCIPPCPSAPSSSGLPSSGSGAPSSRFRWPRCSSRCSTSTRTSTSWFPTSRSCSPVSERRRTHRGGRGESTRSRLRRMLGHRP